MARAGTKEKKTFSLSREAVAFLESARRKSHKPVSQIVEDLIIARKAEAEQQRIAAAITSYYDSLGEGEVDEDRIWGEFAESQLKGE